MANEIEKTKSAAAHWFKWLVVGILGMFALFLIFVAFIVWQFSPLVTNDEDKVHVKILGGLINIDGQNAKGLTGNTPASGNVHLEEIWSGSETLQTPNRPAIADHTFVFDFASGNLTLSPAPDQDLRWNCQSSVGPAPAVTRSNGEIRLSAGHIPQMHCKMLIPKGISIHFRGTNGEVVLKNLSNAVDGQLTNGHISFTPAAESTYRFATKVDNGVLSPFPTELGKLLVNLKVGNGTLVYTESSPNSGNFEDAPGSIDQNPKSPSE
mgnify:CR=1 FL=1